MDNFFEVFELVKVVKIFFYKFDFLDNIGGVFGLEMDKIVMGNLVSEKLFQFFQVCLVFIVKWNQFVELCGLYYSICYCYFIGVVDNDGGDMCSLSFFMVRIRIYKVIQNYGEKFFYVICDDVYGFDMFCQIVVMVFLLVLVYIFCFLLYINLIFIFVIEFFNRFNFIGVLVDLLKIIL